MKKIITSTIILMIITFNLNTLALSKWDTSKKQLHKQTEILTEEIYPIRNNTGQMIGIDVEIIIPSDCEEKELIINPDIFGAIKQYKNITSQDNININITIKNNSMYNYSYQSNSFILSTDNNYSQDIINNCNMTQAIGFDTSILYDNFATNRVFNTALFNLYNYNDATEQKENDLTNEKLSQKLQQKGYQGIEDLDKYYLDYYNNKYNLKEQKLENFTNSTIKEMFSGTKTSIKETNPELIELAYNYFYNKILYFTFSKEQVTNPNCENYSIGAYMREEKSDDPLQEAFNLITTNTEKKLTNMTLNMNKLYTPDVYSDYPLEGHLEFSLIKTEQEISNPAFNDEDLIIPPNTGI